MTSEERERRDSRALEPELITDPHEKAAAEARNGFRQYDAAIGTIQSALDRGTFRLRPSLILGLHREALAGISSYAGNYRPGGVAIEGSKHEPIGAHQVRELVEDMCDYVNDHWEASTPIHLAVYVMWRLNWIHPVADGNGRTSRIVSYVVLSIRAGALLPGADDTDQIVDNRKPYFDALDAADWLSVTADGSTYRRWKAYWAPCWPTNLPNFTSRSVESCQARLRHAVIERSPRVVPYRGASIERKTD